ncbi:MAG: tetratricopeptide repeat protein, partial [Henriciella sp.]
EDFPRDWSWAEASLAASHIDLGHMRSDTDAFETAITYCDGAIGGYASADMPAKKAWVQGLKGNALVGLRRFDEALDVFRAARSWQSYDNAGDDWIMSTNNLAACLLELGRHDEAIATLREALLAVPDDNPRLSSTLTVIEASRQAAEDADTVDAVPEEPVLAPDADPVVSEEHVSQPGEDTDVSDDPGLGSDEESSTSDEPVSEPGDDAVTSDDPVLGSGGDIHLSAGLDGAPVAEPGGDDAVSEDPVLVPDEEALAVTGSDATDRYYHVSVQGYCGEFVIGQLHPDFYSYWKDRDDFEEQIMQLGDPAEFEDGSPSPHPDGREPEGWYTLDDIAHMNNAVFHGNRIYVEEVVPDPDAFNGYASKPDGYSEDFDIDGVKDAMPASFCQLS